MKLFKLSPSAVVSAIVWLACTTFMPAAQAEDAPDAPAVSGLDRTLFYEILLAELSIQDGDSGYGYQLLMDAARKSTAPELYEHSMEVALRARSGEAALGAAVAWSKAFPASPQAHRFVLQILIGLNRLADTSEAIKRALANLSSDERLLYIEQLPGSYSRAADKKAALKVMEAALAPELANHTNGPAAYAAIGTMRVLTGDFTGALESARKGFAINPAAGQPALLALGLMTAQLPAAETLVQGYLENAPAPEIRMGYIRKLLEAQRYADATAQVMELTSHSPEFADGWLVRGSLEMQARNNAQADTSLQTYLALKTAETSKAGADPAEQKPPVDDDSDDAAPQDTPAHRGEVQAYFLLAQIALQNKDYDRANKYLDDIEGPVEPLRLNAQRAAVLAQQGQVDAALALIDGTPEAAATDARAKLNAKSQLLRDNKQYQAEYKLLQGAVAADPQDPDLLYDLAMVADRLSKPEEMESLLRRVIAAKPDYPHAYNALGYSLADRNIRLDEARTLINKAIELAPNDPFITDSLGWVEFRSGNLQEALNLLRDAYQNKHDAEIAAHLGEVLWQMNQQAQAKAIWNEGIAISPDNEVLRETIQRLKAW